MEQAEAQAGESAMAELVEHIGGGAKFLFGKEGGWFCGGFLICNLFCLLA